MKNGLDVELDDNLSFSKYVSKNKDTDNSRNGYSSKMLRTNFGKWTCPLPETARVSLSPSF